MLGAVLEFYFRLVTNEQPINGDRWKVGNAVIKTRVFFKGTISPPNVVASVMGLYPSCADQLYSVFIITANTTL